MNDKTFKELLGEADAAANAAKFDQAIKVILQILRGMESGTLRMNDASGIADDIAWFEGRAEKEEKAGNADGAKKSRQRAQMLKSAKTLDDSVETPEEKGGE